MKEDSEILEGLKFVNSISNDAIIKNKYIIANINNITCYHPIDIDIDGIIDIKSAILVLKKIKGDLSITKSNYNTLMTNKEITVDIGSSFEFEEIRNVIPGPNITLDLYEICKLYKNLLKSAKEYPCLYFKNNKVVGTNNKILLEYWLSKEIPEFNMHYNLVKAINKIKSNPNIINICKDGLLLNYDKGVIYESTEFIELHNYDKIITAINYIPTEDLNDKIKSILPFNDGYVIFKENKIFSGKASITHNINYPFMKIPAKEMEYFIKYAKYYEPGYDLRFCGGNIRGVIVSLREGE